MTLRMSRLALVLLAPLMLVGCLLAPGKFTSSMVINADRTFTYTYVGEVYGFDMEEAMKGAPGMGGDTDDKKDKKDGVSLDKVAFAPDDAKDKAANKASADAKNRALAETLSKEAGFRKVTYVGDNKFMIDYQISGKLDHSFIFPYNIDAGIIIPFIAVEVRANGTVRVKAPGFANDSKTASGSAGMGDEISKTASKLDGVFTLDTNAEIVSQNNEDGAKTAGGRTMIAWKATPLSNTAPMAVLKFPAVAGATTAPAK